MFAVAGCGGDDAGNPPAPTAPPAQTAPPASALETRIAELETTVAEYCEIRSSRSATAADRARAVAAADALIRLARRRAAARTALEETSVVIKADCRDPALQRHVDRALRALR